MRSFLVLRACWGKLVEIQWGGHIVLWQRKLYSGSIFAKELLLGVSNIYLMSVKVSSNFNQSHKSMCQLWANLRLLSVLMTSQLMRSFLVLRACWGKLVEIQWGEHIVLWQRKLYSGSIFAKELLLGVSNIYLMSVKVSSNFNQSHIS